MTLIPSLGNHDGDSKENVKKQQALTSKTMSLQVRYTLWYISLPCSAKQQREMTSFMGFRNTLPWIFFSLPILERRLSEIQFLDSSAKSDKLKELEESRSRIKEPKYTI